MNFADNLKKIRKDNNLSQEQLAEKLGVSRQAVSKWESGVAYPEMDKMIQIVKMFNLNIDELLNQDIKEVNSNKQSKININKYIDDFLGYVTKTIDMFSSMKFKEKCKCVFEQALIILVLFIGLLILGEILSQVYASIFSFLPSKVYYPIYHFLEGIYLIFWILFVVVLECHIFKVRYLDYYEIVNEKQYEVKNDEVEKNIDKIEKDNTDKNCDIDKVYLEKKKEKIIIRDPMHSEYKFITGLVNCILFIIKGIMSLVAIGFCMSFMGLVVCLIISFMFIKTGWLFGGLLTGFLGCILLNFIILVMLYNFIISSIVNKRKLAWLFVTSMILMASGIGFGLIGISRFNYIDSIKDAHTYEVIKETIEMTDDLVIVENYPGITYQVSDNKDIEIIIEKSNTHLVTIDTYWNSQAYYFSLYPLEKNIFKNIRDIIQDINNLEIINYDDMIITIKTSKENIDKITKNNKEYFKSQNEVEQQNMINDYERQIREYENQVNYLQDKLCNIDLEYCNY